MPDAFGDASTAPLEIVEITPHDGPPGRHDRDEIVRLIIKLRPRPPERELWWWSQRVAGDRGPHAFTHIPSADWFTVQFDARRDLLAPTVVEVRAAVAAANRDYPDQYVSDAQARSEAEDRLDQEREWRLHADQAVIDEGMRRPPQR